MFKVAVIAPRDEPSGEDADEVRRGMERMERIRGRLIAKATVIAPRDEPSGGASEVGSVVEGAEVVPGRLITRSDDGYFDQARNSPIGRRALAGLLAM